MTWCPPYLKISPGILSGPAALLFFRRLTARCTSLKEGISSSRGICGRDGSCSTMGGSTGFTRLRSSPKCRGKDSKRAGTALRATHTTSYSEVRLRTASAKSVAATMLEQQRMQGIEPCAKAGSRLVTQETSGSCGLPP